MSMEYRRLGPPAAAERVVLRVLGVVRRSNRITEATECLQAAYDAGVNFSTMLRRTRRRVGTDHGRGDCQAGWERHAYVISTKLYWGIHDVPT